MKKVEMIVQAVIIFALVAVIGVLIGCAVSQNNSRTKLQQRVRVYAGDSLVGDWIADSRATIDNHTGRIYFMVNGKRKSWGNGVLTEDTLISK
jgi:hypothetical protein